LNRFQLSSSNHLFVSSSERKMMCGGEQHAFHDAMSKRFDAIANTSMLVVVNINILCV
jgi:hypothetical protein